MMQSSTTIWRLRATLLVARATTATTSTKLGSTRALLSGNNSTLTCPFKCSKRLWRASLTIQTLLTTWDFLSSKWKRLRKPRTLSLRLSISFKTRLTSSMIRISTRPHQLTTKIWQWPVTRSSSSPTSYTKENSLRLKLTSTLPSGFGTNPRHTTSTKETSSSSSAISRSPMRTTTLPLNWSLGMQGTITRKGLLMNTKEERITSETPLTCTEKP